jgi:hypothetical protein
MSILEARSDGCRYCKISKTWYHSIRHCILRTFYSHAMCVGARIQADLHQLVVFIEIFIIQLVDLKIVANQALPRHWQTEGIEAVLVAEVLHLTSSQVGRRAAIRALEIIRRKIALEQGIRQVRLSTKVAKTQLGLHLCPCRVRIQRGLLRQARRRWLALQGQRSRKIGKPLSDDSKEVTAIFRSEKQSESRYIHRRCALIFPMAATAKRHHKLPPP